MKKLSKILLIFIFMFVMMGHVSAAFPDKLRGCGSKTECNTTAPILDHSFSSFQTQGGTTVTLDAGLARLLAWVNGSYYSSIFCTEPGHELHWVEYSKNGTVYTNRGKACGILYALENSSAPYPVSTSDLSNYNSDDEAYKRIQKAIWYYNDYSSTCSAKTTNVQNITSSVNLTSSSDKLTPSGNYYVSSKITIGKSNLTTDNYTVTLSATSDGFLPSGTFVTTDASATSGVTSLPSSTTGFYVKVPASSVTKTPKFKVKLTVKGKTQTGSRTNITLVEYSDISSTYDSQNLSLLGVETVPYTNTENKSDEITLKSELGSFIIKKYNDVTKKPIAGAEFTLYDKNGDAIRNVTTGSNGSIEVKNLQFGTYTLVETKTLVGYYSLKKQLVFKITGPKTIEFVNGDPYSFSITGGNTLNVYNSPLYQNFIKRDITNEEEIEGAKISIYNSSGVEIKKFTSSDTNNTFYLEPGEYALKETYTPEGYIPIDTTFKFKVLANGDFEIIESGGNKLKSSHRNMILYNEPKKIKISKKDITNEKELEGAHIVIKDEDGKSVVEFDSKKESSEFVLQPGKYTMIETSTPIGYEKVETEFKFKVKEDRTVELIKAGNNIKLDKDGGIVLYNEPKKVKISKKDITNEKELDGAHIVIKKEDGTIVKEFDSKKEPTEFILEPGVYLLVETVAPKGYQKTETVFKFQVQTDRNIKLLSVNNNSVVDKKDRTHLIIYNTPMKVPVPNTAKNIIIYGILGFIFMISGGILFYIKYKKQNEV